jgi:hypothetical protein
LLASRYLRKRSGSLLLRVSVVCPQAPAFLARANAITALDGTHTIAYTNSICGLVADGVWPKFDVLMVFATQSFWRLAA